MTIGKGKRPRDPNQLAKWIVDQSTDEAAEEFVVPDKPAPPSDLIRLHGRNRAQRWSRSAVNVGSRP
jgi:hypothetical protein